MDDERTEAERIDSRWHVSASDPRYDGFRIREYWIATAVGPDNQEGPLFVEPITAFRFHLSPGPAMAADERRLRHLREFAAIAARESGYEVRVRHFVPSDEDDEVFNNEEDQHEPSDTQ